MTTRINNPGIEYLREELGINESSELAAQNYIRNSEREHNFLVWYRVALRNERDELENYQQANWGEDSAFYANQR